MNIKELKSYEDFLLSENLSTNTVTSYLSDVTSFLRHIHKVLNIHKIDQVTEEIISEYLSFVKEHSKDSTVSRKEVSIASFFSHLKRAGIVLDDPTARLERTFVDKSLTDSRTIDREIRFRLLQSYDESNKYDFRDKCIYSIFWELDTYLEEIASLRIGDFDSKNRTIKLKRKWGDVYATLSYETASMLIRYMSSAREEILNGRYNIHIFPSQKNCPINRKSLWRKLDEKRKRLRR
jgi:integrase/recombinase XerD